MKPLLEEVTKGNYSFYIKREKTPYFIFPWHYHPELEIIHVEKGTGTRFVGDHIERFEENDLVMMGSMLPHRWKSDDLYYTSQQFMSIAKVIHFQEDFWGKDFLSLPEMKNISSLIKISRRGIKPIGELKKRVIQRMHNMYYNHKINKISVLIEMLEDMAQSKEYEILSSEGFINCIRHEGNGRLKKVFEYIMNHFNEPVNFSQIASIANMSEAGFSRYFKKHTGKTFSQYLIELRIGYACRLILSQQFSISQIAFECGFNNLSYFNEQFKKQTGHTPREYLRTYIKEKY